MAASVIFASQVILPCGQFGGEYNITGAVRLPYNFCASKNITPAEAGISLEACRQMLYNDGEVSKMAQSVMRDTAKAFAVKIVTACRDIRTTQKEAVMTNQLLRAGTSIGANLHEAQYAQGTKDFISKLEIALKECHESEYWLDILFETGYMDGETYKVLKSECGSIRRMLIASINTIKSKKSKSTVSGD